MIGAQFSMYTAYRFKNIEKCYCHNLAVCNNVLKQIFSDPPKTHKPAPHNTQTHSEPSRISLIYTNIQTISSFMP